MNKAKFGNLSIHGFKKTLPGFELRAEFSVAPGERAVLSGRSGSGKTTLLRWIAGLDAASGGRLNLGDFDLTSVAIQKRNVGLVFQESTLFPSMSVLDNAAFGLKMRGVSRQERQSQALEWLERVGLKAKASEGIQHLSGGEKQRIAFVRALIWKPDFILLDEPFSALDSETRERLRQDLIALHGTSKVPMILVTHDDADVRALATSRLVIEELENQQIRNVRKI